MPDEPNGKIEELLKAYANKRREDAGPSLELHPATRKLLQGEVARTRPPAATPSRSTFKDWFVFGPRLAWVASILLVLGLAAWLLVPSSQKPQASSFAAADGEAQLALVNRSVVREEALRISPADKLSEGDREYRRGVSLELADATPPASPTPVPAPSVRAEERKDASVRDQKSKNRALDESSNRVGADAPAIAANGQQQYFFSQSATGASQVLSYANQPSSLSLADSFQTTGALFGVAAAQAPVPLPNLGLAPMRQDAGERNFTLAQPSPGEPLARYSESEALAGGVIAAAQPVPVRKQEAGGQEAGQTVLARARFNQVAGVASPRPLGFANSAAILDTFELEQQGDRIRVLDADGSVYEGKLAFVEQGLKKDRAGVNANAGLKEATKQATARAQGGAGTREMNDAKAQNISFRASGTNRSLNQLVVLDCTFIPVAQISSDDSAAKPAVVQSSPSATQAAAPVFRYAPAQRQLDPTRTQNLPLERVQGVARVGNTNQIQIDAVRVSP